MTAFWMSGASAVLHCLLLTQQQAVGVTRESGPEYNRAYETGAAEAELALKRGEATLYFYGLVKPREWLDRSTGLPLERIADCVARDSDRGRADGHNQRVMEFIAKEGLPRNSFKRWENELFNLKQYYEERCKNERPQALTLDDKVAKSLDGIHRMRLTKVPAKRTDREVANTPVVVISAKGLDLASLRIEGAVDCFWGPPESGFAVIRAKNDGTLSFIAVDLRRGRSLRTEYTVRPQNRRPRDG